MQDYKTINYSNIFLHRQCDKDTERECQCWEHTLVYVCSGELEIVENGRTLHIREGECVFIRRDHRIYLNKRCSRINQTYQSIALKFSREFLLDFYRKLEECELPKDVKRSRISVMRINARPETTSLFESIRPFFDAETNPAKEWLNLKLIEGLYILLNENRNVYASLFDFADPWKIDLLGFMNDNYMYDLTMEEMAHYTGRSLTTFKRDFKKINGLTPGRWIIQRRLEKARELIIVHHRKVKEVIDEVGFKNMSHFSKLYKASYGIAPSLDKQG